MSFTPPTKEEIKDKYQIADDDFEILISRDIPEANVLQREDSLLEKVAGYFGVPTFLKKHRITGLVIAVLFLPGWLPKVYDKGKDVFLTTYDFYQTQAAKLSRIYDGESKYLVYQPGSFEISNKKYNLGDMPIASGVIGISGTDINRFMIS